MKLTKDSKDRDDSRKGMPPADDDGDEEMSEQPDTTMLDRARQMR